MKQRFENIDKLVKELIEETNGISFDNEKEAKIVYVLMRSIKALSFAMVLYRSYMKSVNKESK